MYRQSFILTYLPYLDGRESFLSRLGKHFLPLSFPPLCTLLCLRTSRLELLYLQRESFLSRLAIKYTLVLEFSSCSACPISCSLPIVKWGSEPLQPGCVFLEVYSFGITDYWLLINYIHLVSGRSTQQGVSNDLCPWAQVHGIGIDENLLVFKRRSSI